MSNAFYALAALTVDPLPRPHHVWFSLTAANRYGSGYWRRANGDLVEVTLVDPSYDARFVYGWEDAEYCGIVVERAGQGRDGELPLPDTVYAPYLPVL